MGNTTLTHKLRNPKDLSKWLDIWTADVTDANNYTIAPSEHWEIPANQITDYIYTPEATQDNPNPDSITEKNTTIENPEGNHIAITNSDGSISEGAKIDEQNGSPAKFLNEQGQWVANNSKLKIQNYKLKYDDDNSYLPTFMLDGINSSGMIPIETVGFINAYVGSTRHSYEIINDTIDPDTGETIIERRRVIGEVPTLILMTSSIGTNNINNGAITTDKLADNSVTTPKIVDESITIDKIAQSAIDAIDTWQPNTLSQDGYVRKPLPTSKPLVWATPTTGHGQPQWMTVAEATGDSSVSIDKAVDDNKVVKISSTQEIYRLDLLETVVTDVTYTINSVTGDVASIDVSKIQNSVSGTTLFVVKTVVTDVVYSPPS